VSWWLRIKLFLINMFQKLVQWWQGLTFFEVKS